MQMSGLTSTLTLSVAATVAPDSAVSPLWHIPSSARAILWPLAIMLFRVVSSEISAGKFLETSYISFPFIRFRYNDMFPSRALQNDAVKWARSWQTTLQIFVLYALC